MKFRIISACMIASLFLAFFASSRSENDLPQAELLSYDYSFNTNFGIGYQTNTVLERSDIKNNQWNDETQKFAEDSVESHKYSDQFAGKNVSESYTQCDGDDNSG